MATLAMLALLGEVNAATATTTAKATTATPTITASMDNDLLSALDEMRSRAIHGKGELTVAILHWNAVAAMADPYGAARR